MVSGTDEHGTPVMVAADPEGKSYGEVADFYNQSHPRGLPPARASPTTCFTRTTTLNHERVTQDLFRTLYEHGAIVEQTMLVSFSPATGHTLPDRYIEGTCPICGYPEARGDQCDNCGNQLDPTDLIDPRSRIDGSTPEFRETKHLFLDLPRVRRRAARPGSPAHDDWRPNVRNFSLGLLDEIRAAADHARPRLGRARSRSPATPRTTNKRIYVWFDAVIGYLSASIEWAATRGEPDAWRDWWQNPDAAARLLPGQGQHRLPHGDLAGDAARLRRRRRVRRRRGRSHLPDNVVATEYLTMEGKQFSTSRGALDLRPRLPRPLRPRPAPLLPRRGRARRRRTPTSRGPSSSAATTTSCSRTGATSSTGR